MTMRSYYYCNLIVKGTEEQMKKFYSKISVGEEVEFKMNKFVPIPDELIAGKEITEDLESLIDFWEELNWGCIKDIDFYYNQIVEPEHYRIKYECMNSVNLIFIYKLVSMFPELEFRYEYSNPATCEAMTYEFENYSINSYENDVHIIYILKNEKNNFSFYNPEDNDENNNFLFLSHEDNDVNSKFYCIDIVGRDVELSLNDEGFNKDNVTNWDELEDYLILSNQDIMFIEGLIPGR